MAAYDFSGKTCLVTGGASGMGRAIALALGRAGGRVYIADINCDGAEAVARTLTDENFEAHAVSLDVTSAESVGAMVDVFREDVPSVLINCVGIGAKPREGEREWDVWNRLIQTNLNGIFRCCCGIGELMIQKGGGTIVSIASMSATIVPEKTRAGRLGEYGLLGYCASKAAVRQMTRGMAALWAGYGIRANTVSPGYVDTPLTSEPHSNPEIRALLESKVPMKRIASPEDIYKTVLFLASDDSAYITGQDIIIDGGYTCL